MHKLGGSSELRLQPTAGAVNTAQYLQGPNNASKRLSHGSQGRGIPANAAAPVAGSQQRTSPVPQVADLNDILAERDACGVRLSVLLRICPDFRGFVPAAVPSIPGHRQCHVQLRAAHEHLRPFRAHRKAVSSKRVDRWCACFTASRCWVDWNALRVHRCSHKRPTSLRCSAGRLHRQPTRRAQPQTHGRGTLIISLSQNALYHYHPLAFPGSACKSPAQRAYTADRGAVAPAYQHQCALQALQALGCMEHRGACSADDDSGDGAGVMTHIPWKLVQKAVPAAEPGSCGYA